MNEVAAKSWQAEYWNGNAGERWAKHQDQIDRALSLFGSAMLNAAGLSSGQRVLDVGCGCGATTVEAARCVAPTGSALGLDISAPMIAKAERAYRANAAVRFVQGDAAQHCFDVEFDRLVSRNGLMFFPEPVQALGHLRRALRPSARLAFVAWRALADNQWLSLPLEAVQRVATATHVADGLHEPGPFAFADRKFMAEVLQTAGFRSIEIERLDLPVLISNAGVERGIDFVELHAGPVGRLLAGLDDAQRLAAREALREALAPHARDERIELAGAAWLVTATAP